MGFCESGQITTRKGRRFDAKQLANYVLQTKTIIDDVKTPERDKRILALYFFENLSATAISQKNDPLIISTSNRSKGENLSPSSVLKIVYKYFPEIENMPQQKPPKSVETRKQLIKKRRKQQSVHIKQCAFCGNEDCLQEHHMIPLFMGGTNHDANLVWLCKSCHLTVTKYQKGLIPKE